MSSLTIQRRSALDKLTLKRSARCRHVLLNDMCLRYELVSISNDKNPYALVTLAFKSLLTRIKLSYRAVRFNELACGSQAFIATLLFDPSMSALPIIPKQNSVSVGLFTH